MGATVMGADACRSGWVVVRLADGRVVDVEVVDALSPLLPPHDPDGPAVLGVDIPIGLTDDARRDADVAARSLLPGRASSIFSAPPRTVVDAWQQGRITTHAQATALAVATTGLGLSQQAWRLVPKIAEVDALAASLGRGPSAPVTLLEVHPELAFTLVVGEPLPRKRSWPGVTTRRSVLARLGLELPDRFPGDEQAAVDDVLDAAICAWVAAARAPSAGGAGLITIPAATVQRDHGAPIVIHGRPPDVG